MLMKTFNRSFCQNKIKDLVYFKISKDGKEMGDLTFKLYLDKVPKTATNFQQLCSDKLTEKSGNGKRLTFKGSSFHRVIPEFMAQGGDFTHNNGTGGWSI